MPRKPLRRLAVPPGATSAGIVCGAFPEPPRIVTLGLAQAGPRWAQSDHSHDAYEIHLLRRGRGTMTYRGRTYPMETGAIYLLKPGEMHGGWANDKDPGQVLYLIFSLPPDLRAGVEALFERSPILSRNDCVELRSALEALAEHLSVLGQESAGQQKTQLASVPASVVSRAMHVIAALIDPLRAPQAITGTQRERDLAEAALREIEMAGPAGTTAARVAATLQVTSAYLGSVLRKVTGHTFPDLVAQKRLRLARQLLNDPNLPLREVARRVGLSSPRALTKLFRRLTGKAPGAFRGSRQ